MPKLKNIVPSYRLHKQSKQAIVTLNGRDYLLGPHGTKSSRTKYNKLVGEWLNNNRQPLATDGLSIGELTARYWEHAARYYVKGGLPTQEQDCIRMAIRPLLKIYERELAANFGPRTGKELESITAGRERSPRDSEPPGESNQLGKAVDLAIASFGL